MHHNERWGSNRMPYLHAVVEGIVQGVGYRWFVVDEAQRLGIDGVVRNLSDGDVEVEAVGDRVLAGEHQNEQAGARGQHHERRDTGGDSHDA